MAGFVLVVKRSTLQMSKNATAEVLAAARKPRVRWLNTDFCQCSTTRRCAAFVKRRLTVQIRPLAPISRLTLPALSCIIHFMKEQKPLTVQKFIDNLKRAKDIDIAPLSFAIEGQPEKTYGLKSMSQFGLCADVIVTLEEVEVPILTPTIFQRKHRKMVKNKERQINKSLKSRR
jgi:hypothetical protein